MQRRYEIMWWQVIQSRQHNVVVSMVTGGDGLLEGCWWRGGGSGGCGR